VRTMAAFVGPMEVRACQPLPCREAALTFLLQRLWEQTASSDPAINDESSTYYIAMARNQLISCQFYGDGPETGVDPFRSISGLIAMAFPPRVVPQDVQNQFIRQTLVFYTLYRAENPDYLLVVAKRLRRIARDAKDRGVVTANLMLLQVQTIDGMIRRVL
jgi:hypothetical protein